MKFIYCALMCCLSLIVFGQETAPDFSFQYEDGRMGTLASLDGEVVYVSFWASWCGPCISGFRKYRDMREQLAEMGVTLLNVNIDESKSLWEDALAKHDINGIHVRGEALADLQALYKLYSIPVYEIVNKRGKLVYLSDAPDRNILADFEQWLNE